MKITAFSRSGPFTYEAGLSVDGREVVLFDYWSVTGSRHDLAKKFQAGWEEIAAAVDASTGASPWSAEFRAMADQYDSVASEPAYTSTIAAALREAADDPPDCEEAFRFRLCLILDWHPNRDKADLDAAVSRARARKVS